MFKKKTFHIYGSFLFIVLFTMCNYGQHMRKRPQRKLCNVHTKIKQSNISEIDSYL